MKKIYLLLFLCGISTITIFASENKKNEKLAGQSIDYWTYINEIDQLKKKHAQEIAMYQEKIFRYELQEMGFDPNWKVCAVPELEREIKK